MPPSTHHGILTRVAQAAGVSNTTVSKVVHDRPDVSLATRQRIEELLTEYGYVRPWQPGAGRSPELLALFRDLDAPHVTGVALGIVSAAAAAGSATLLGTTLAGPLDYWLNECDARRAAGLIVEMSEINDAALRKIRRRRLPVVPIDALGDPRRTLPGLAVSDISGAATAVDHLLGLGHRRIAALLPSSPLGAAAARDCTVALIAAGLEADDALIRLVDDAHHAAASAQDLLADDRGVTAVLTVDDVQAFAVLDVARRMGRCVPTDLSVVALDDTAAVAGLRPPLTTIRRPFEKLGREATRVLLAMALGAAPPTSRRELRPTVMTRGSTGTRPDYVGAAGEATN